VGATDHYVKDPLILQGVLFGGLAALVAGLLIGILTAILNLSGAFSGNLSLGFLPITINQYLFSFIVVLLLVISGVALGYLGSTTAVKRYLKY
jgi:cell division protein FtsX